jgi:hypothetical protein
LNKQDEDIADRVRFQSLVYLAQERLAIEAGLPALAQERLSTVWIMAIGPSVVTEDRYNKAMEILKKRHETFSDATMRLIDCKPVLVRSSPLITIQRRQNKQSRDARRKKGRDQRRFRMGL